MGKMSAKMKKNRNKKEVDNVREVGGEDERIWVGGEKEMRR